MDIVGKKAGGGWARAVTLAALAFLALVIVAIVSAPDPPDEPAAEARPVMEVTAEEVRAAYEANEVAAQAAYDGKDLRITGTIHRIMLDVANEPLVELATARPYDTVLLNFDDEFAAKTAALRKGREFTATCKYFRASLTSPRLTDCGF